MRDGTRYEATSFGLCLKDRGPGFAELRDVCLDVKDRIYKENNYRRHLLYTSIVYLIILLIELSISCSPCFIVFK